MRHASDNREICECLNIIFSKARDWSCLYISNSHRYNCHICHRKQCLGNVTIYVIPLSCVKILSLNLALCSEILLFIVINMEL